MEYEDPTRLESHIKKVQESLLKIAEDVKESKEKPKKNHQKLQYNKKIN